MDEFTQFHVAISVIGLVTGYIVLGGMAAGKRLAGWTAVFLITTTATSVTGFFFPFKQFLPAHAFGIISLVVLALAFYSLFNRRLVGPWRLVYVIGIAIAQHLNVVVLIVQAYLKTPVLQALAPNQTEPPFLLTQVAALALTVVLTLGAASQLRPSAPDAA